MAEPALLVLQGGTFDPVHCGHLAIAEAARDRLDAAVRLMPAADPPHRAPTGADGRHRAAMLALAVIGRPGLHVDLRELDAGVPSRTIDTLAGLRATHGEAQPIACVVGADAFLGLPGWKGWPALLDAAHWVVAARGDASLEALPPALAGATAGRWTADPADLRRAPGGRLLRLDQPLHPASATRIRAGIAAGDPAWRALVPDAVAAYIDHHRLYIAAGAGSGARDPSPPFH